MPKYLCIDDDRDTENVLRPLRDAGLEVRLTAPKTEHEQFEELRSTSYDGVILDFVLDEIPNGDYQVTYSSNLPARFVRDLGMERPDRDVPIVIWSGNPKLKRFYKPDLIAQNLYDTQYDKSDVADNSAKIVRELTALAEAYVFVRGLSGNKQDRFIQMLGLEREQAALLDPRVGMRLLIEDIDFAAHEYIRFIKTELIDQPHPLVDEALLAARFGIDITASGESWPQLLKQLESCRYSGVLNFGWPRWWYDRVREWWRQSVKQTALRDLDALERIAILTERSGLPGLVAAKPIEDSYSTRFYSLCDVLHLPLDPIDGFLSNKTSLEPWHDARYISLRALIDREGESEGVVVHPSDAIRLRETIATSSNG